jgi:hypothetical protein
VQSTFEQSTVCSTSAVVQQWLMTSTDKLALPPRRPAHAGNCPFR